MTRFLAQAVCADGSSLKKLDQMILVSWSNINYCVTKQEITLKNNVIVVSATSGTGSTDEVPDWIKNNACWWSEGQIDDNTFVNGVKYLIEKRIIQVYISAIYPTLFLQIPTIFQQYEACLGIMFCNHLFQLLNIERRLILMDVKLTSLRNS